MKVLDSFSLKGKVALVTGGAGKYGKQILQAVAEAGAITYVAARNLEALQKEAKKLNDRGYDVRACKYDQGKEETILALRDHIIGESGRIDVLVNNSVARIVDSWDNDPKVYQESLNINVTGVFSMCRAFGDIMKKQNSGSIINIGSIYGMVGYDPSLYIGTDMVSADPHPAYYVEKGGMIMLTKFIGSYLGKNNIRVNCISPGRYSSMSAFHVTSLFAKRWYGFSPMICGLLSTSSRAAFSSAGSMQIEPLQNESFAASETTKSFTARLSHVAVGKPIASPPSHFADGSIRV